MFSAIVCITVKRKKDFQKGGEMETGFYETEELIVLRRGEQKTARNAVALFRGRKRAKKSESYALN